MSSRPRIARGLLRSALALVVALPVAAALLPGRAFAAAPAGSAAHIGDLRLRRFALMAGFNDGGPTRPQLRYATSDARAMSRVLESLGGIAPDDIVFVSDASRPAFLAAFDRLGRMVVAGQRAGIRREVVVYYSGHSDEDGLLIGNDRVSYDELRARIQGIPAEVRLAILDSCASGAFTRRKGGVRRAPFLMDASADTKGHAYLASSAINEVAQESDRIGASFFTHYLVSGLRGAADVNRDRRVTLQEAFQFAAQETLARTEKTQGGPQHAAYEFDLVGTSDLVVTDVRSTQATLALASDLSGRIGVRDAAGNLVVELRKAGGHGIELGLEAGPYVVTMDGNGNTVFEASVTLALGQRAELERLAFHPGRPLEVVATRGDAPAPAPSTTVTAVASAPSSLNPPRTPLHSVPVHLGLVPLPGDPEVDVHGLSFSLIADRIGGLSSGTQLSLGANIADQFMYGTQLSVGANLLRGPGRGAQLAAGLNFSQGAFRGTQLASGANVAFASFNGAQLAAGANWTEGELHGAQLGAGVNVLRGGGRGAQLAGGLNLMLGRWKGAQLAGGVNLADEMSGAQLAPVNIVSTLKGAQLGVVNLANDQIGSQVGVINAARHSRGFKLGVINVANDHDGETIGLINVIGNGIHSVAVYTTDTMLSNFELQLGSRHVYTSYTFGYQPGDALVSGAGPDQFHRGTRRLGSGLGIGYRQPVDAGPLRFLAIEVSAMSITSDFSSYNNTPLSASTRVVAGFQIVPSLSAIAGISDNATIAWDGKDLDIGTGVLQSVSHSGTTTIRHYPGLLGLACTSDRGGTPAGDRP